MESNPNSPLEPVEPCRPPAGYIGGKRILAKRLVPMISAIEHRCYAEPFVGMGGVFFRRDRRAPSEAINDWNDDVANLFRILQHHYVPFMDMLRFQITSRSNFEKLLALEPSSLTDLQRAARFIYLQRTAFGGKVTQQAFGTDTYQGGRFDITALGPVLEAIHERLGRVRIERLPWSDFIDRYDRPHTLFYLDPPYYGNETDYGAGMFAREEFDAMAEQLARIRGRFILSLNDRSEVRRIFAGFAFEEAELNYSIGNNHRPCRARELIITGGA
jgi:DNA adenine methylase